MLHAHVGLVPQDAPTASPEGTAATAGEVTVQILVVPWAPKSHGLEQLGSQPGSQPHQSFQCF